MFLNSIHKLLRRIRLYYLDHNLLIHYYFYKKVCKEVLNGQRLYDGKGILWISIGVTIVGIAVAFINHFLWLKYSIIIAILILLIVKRNTVINIVKDMIGKEK